MKLTDICCHNRCEVLHGKVLDMSKVFPENYDMLMPPKENGKYNIPLILFIKLYYYPLNGYFLQYFKKGWNLVVFKFLLQN